MPWMQASSWELFHTRFHSLWLPVFFNVTFYFVVPGASFVCVVKKAQTTPGLWILISRFSWMFAPRPSHTIYRRTHTLICYKCVLVCFISRREHHSSLSNLLKIQNFLMLKQSFVTLLHISILFQSITQPPSDVWPKLPTPIIVIIAIGAYLVLLMLLLVIRQFLVVSSHKICYVL